MRTPQYRRKVTQMVMAKYQGQYQCCSCIHKQVRTCKGLANGCEYYSNETTGRTFTDWDRVRTVKALLDSQVKRKQRQRKGHNPPRPGVACY